MPVSDPTSKLIHCPYPQPLPPSRQIYANEKYGKVSLCPQRLASGSVAWRYQKMWRRKRFTMYCGVVPLNDAIGRISEFVARIDAEPRPAFPPTPHISIKKAPVYAYAD